jgi:hypothetical protein
MCGVLTCLAGSVGPVDCGGASLVVVPIVAPVVGHRRPVPVVIVIVVVPSLVVVVVVEVLVVVVVCASVLVVVVVVVVVAVAVPTNHSVHNSSNHPGRHLPGSISHDAGWRQGTGGQGVQATTQQQQQQQQQQQL